MKNHQILFSSEHINQSLPISEIHQIEPFKALTISLFHFGSTVSASITLYHIILCCICVVYIKYVNYTQLIFIRVNSFVSRRTSLYVLIYTYIYKCNCVDPSPIHTHLHIHIHTHVHTETHPLLIPVRLYASADHQEEQQKVYVFIMFSSVSQFGLSIINCDLYIYV